MDLHSCHKWASGSTRILSLLIWLAWVTLVRPAGVAFAQAAEPPAFAVLPLLCEDDPDYSVVISDRIAGSLLERSRMVESGRRRFRVVEPDTPAPEALRKIAANRRNLEPADLEILREATRADFVLIGVEVRQKTPNPQVKHLRFDLVDLASGRTAWSGQVKHDIRYLWISKQWEGGATLDRDLMRQMGFVESDRTDLLLEPAARPRRVVMAPLFTTGHSDLAYACRRILLREAARDSLFLVVKGPDEASPRIGPGERSALADVADAVLTGSLMELGMTEAVEENLVLTLRLVDVRTGAILWTGAASDRRIWRQEEADEMAERVVGVVYEGLRKAWGRNGEGPRTADRGRERRETGR